MSIRNTRAGFTQPKFNDDASSVVIFKILVIAVAFGIGMQIWRWGGGVFLEGVIVISTPILKVVFCYAMSTLWAAANFQIDNEIGQGGANHVTGILARLISVGFHLGAIKWAEDMA